MPRVTTFYPGTGIDIATQIDGQLVVGTVEGSRVRFQRGLGVEYSMPAPRALLQRTLRVAVNSIGEVAAICQITQPDQAAVYFRGAWDVMPTPAFGQEPCAIAAEGREFVWAVVTNGGGTLRLFDEGGFDADVAIPGATSQGILQYQAGQWVLADARRSVQVNDRELFRVTSAGEWGVGYGSDCVMVGKPGYLFTLVQGNPSTPRLAVSGDTVHVAYQFQGKPTVETLTPPYPVERVAIPSIGRPLWLGWYRFGQSPVMPPGNCEIRVVHGQDKFITTPSGRVIAAYAEGVPDGDINAVDRAVAAMASHGVTVAPYWTRKAQKGRLPRGTDTVVVEAYRLAGESIPDYEARVTANVRRVGWAWLAVNVYTSNTNNHPDLQSVVPVIARIAKANTNVVGILGFSAGTGRASGWDDHPEVHDDWRALYAGIPSAPSLPKPTPKPTAPTPPVEIDMPKMTYDEGLAVVLKAKEKWRAIHRPGQPSTNDVDAGQAFHWAWRALYEGWSEAKILEDVK